MQIYLNEPNFSLDPLYEKGYITFEVEQNFSRLLHKLIKKERFILDKPEMDCNQSYEGRLYVNSPNNLKEKYIQYINKLLEPFIKSLAIYNWDGKYDLNFLKANPNYWMGWHADILGESHLSILTYFTEQDITPEHGGQLLISKVKRNADGHIIDRVETGRITPKLGQVVVLDNQMPCFQHCVEKMNIPYERYLLDINIRRFVDLDINNNEHNRKPIEK